MMWFIWLGATTTAVEQWWECMHVFERIGMEAAGY